MMSEKLEANIGGQKTWLREDGCIFPEDEFKKGIDMAQERLIHEEYGMMPKNIDDLFKKASEDALMDQLIYGESMIKIDNEDGIRRIEPGSDEYFRSKDSCSKVEHLSAEEIIDRYGDYLSDSELNKLKDFYE